MSRQPGSQGGQRQSGCRWGRSVAGSSSTGGVPKGRGESGTDHARCCFGPYTSTACENFMPLGPPGSIFSTRQMVTEESNTTTDERADPLLSGRESGQMHWPPPTAPSPKVKVCLATVLTHSFPARLSEGLGQAKLLSGGGSLCFRQCAALPLQEPGAGTTRTPCLCLGTLYTPGSLPPTHTHPPPVFAASRGSWRIDSCGPDRRS